MLHHELILAPGDCDISRHFITTARALLQLVFFSINSYNKPMFFYGQTHIFFLKPNKAMPPSPKKRKRKNELVD